MNYWIENATEPRQHTLVDCGYLKDKAARDRADRLLKHVSRKNIVVGGNGRLMVRIPPAKVRDVLKAIPQVQEGAGTYCWCTHGWRNDGDRTP